MVDDQEASVPLTPSRRGGLLALRSIASVLLTPVGALWLFFNTEITGSPGSTTEARVVVWWLEPFRQLRRTTKDYQHQRSCSC